MDGPGKLPPVSTKQLHMPSGRSGTGTNSPDDRHLFAHCPCRASVSLMSSRPAKAQLQVPLLQIGQLTSQWNLLKRVATPHQVAGQLSQPRIHTAQGSTCTWQREGRTWRGPATGRCTSSEKLWKYQLESKSQELLDSMGLGWDHRPHWTGQGRELLQKLGTWDGTHWHNRALPSSKFTPSLAGDLSRSCLVSSKLTTPSFPPLLSLVFFFSFPMYYLESF